MVLKHHAVIDDDDLTDADRAILDALHAGPRTKGAIVDETGLHRNTVGNRLDALKFGEAIEAIHDRTALYELVDDPRDGTEEGSAASPEDVRQERDAYESDLEEAGGEINALVEEVETLQDQLTAAPDRGEIEAAIEDLEAACEQGDRNGVDVALERLREAAGIDDGE